MEDINKKNLLHIFLGVIMIQSLFLLVYSANFLLAEDSGTTTNYIVINSPVSNENISGTKTFSATSFSSEIEHLSIYMKNTNTGLYYGFTASTTDNMNWTVTEDVSSWESGNYEIYAKGFDRASTYNFDNTPYISDNVSVYINGTVDETATTNPLAIEFISLPSSPLSGDQTIHAQTSKMVNSIEFKVIPGINGAAYTPYTGTLVTGSDNEYSFIWPTASFADGIYDLRAIAYDGTSTVDVYANIDLNVDNSSNSNSTPEITVRTENNQTILQNTKYFYADISTEHSLNNLIFYFDNLNTTIVDNYSFYGGVSSDLKSWSAMINTAEMPDGEYNFYAKGLYEGTLYDSRNYISVTIDNNNSLANDLQINFDSIPPSSIFGDNTISAFTNIEPDSVRFEITGPQNSTFTGIENSPTNYYFLWDTVSFPDGYYSVKAIAKKDTIETYDSFNVNVNNTDTAITPIDTDLTIKFINLPFSPLSEDQTIHAQTSGTVSSVTFKVIPGINGAAYTRYPGTLVTGSDNEYYFTWPTASFADGIYDLRAIAYDGTSTVDVYAYNFEVQNETVDEPVITTPLSVQFVNFPPSPFSNDQIIYIETNQSVASVIFKVLTNGIAVGTYTGIADNAKPYRYYFTWPTANFNDGNYMIKTIASNRTETVYDFKYIEVSNNLPIDSTNASLAVKFIEDFQVPIKGDQKISISANQEILSCMFKIEGSKFIELSGIKDSSTQCHILLDTINFPNGYYTIRAIAKNNASVAEIKLDVKIENIEESSTTETPMTDGDYPIEETDPTATTYDDYVYPETFIFELPLDCKERNISTPEECQKYMSIPFECREKDILDPEECKKFMIENFMPLQCKEAGITTKEECDYLLRNTLVSFENFSTTEIEPSHIVQTEEIVSSECKEAGITSLQECKKHMIIINMPEECRLAKITDPEECKKIIFEKHGPQECIQAQIFSAQECENFMFKKYPPDDCQKAGILNPEACKKFIFERYSEEENIPAEFPIECEKANAKTIEQCAEVMQKAYIPEECKNEGLENPEECEIYLQQKHMPKECLEAGIKNRQECDRIMFQKYAPQECLKANIENGTKCEEFIFNKYAPKVECSNLESWQCKNSIKERYLGNIVAKQTIYNRINEKKEEIIGKSIEIAKLETKIIQKENSIPILKKNLKLKILSAKESLVLNEEDNLIQTSPIIVMIDSDGDGLPDDIEQRFGTNPYKTDTDGDGFDDLAEIKNEYDPLGDGKLENEVAPIEKAIIENRILEHPKTAGQVNENLTIEDISNTKDGEGNITSEYILSGTAESNSIATIYIYSDLPIVVTVKTDKYGNWEYELKESLIDGEHEAYVVINDDTGKVLSKSNPINFFIKEAKAVSAKNFITPAITPFEIPKESENSLFYYLIAAVGIMIFAIMIFMTFIIKKKRI